MSADPSEQNRLPDNLSFQAWIAHVFDHPADGPEWWWDLDTAEWDCQANPALTLSHLTRLFGEPRRSIGRFSRAQIDRGLNFLINPACSNHLHVLLDAKLPWHARRACFDAMIVLYRDLLAPLYQNDLGHTQRGRGGPTTPTSPATCGGT